MDAADKFIAERNVERFRDQLKAEVDSQRRGTLLRLLVFEEKKLGYSFEQADKTEREIARCRELIQRQQTLVSQLKEAELDTTRADALLESLVRCELVHREHLHRLNREIERSSHTDGEPARPGSSPRE